MVLLPHYAKICEGRNPDLRIVAGFCVILMVFCAFLRGVIYTQFCIKGNILKIFKQSVANKGHLSY